MNEEIITHLNEQVAAEMYSSYLYLGLACEFEHLGLSGFAHWMRLQSSEEHCHAMKIIGHMLSRNIQVNLKDIAATKIEWECPCDAMRSALEHEKLITNRIHEIMKLARQHSDFATETIMTWFVMEQVEEEDTINKIIKNLERVGEDQNGLIFIDKTLAKREHSNPCGGR